MSTVAYFTIGINRAVEGMRQSDFTVTTGSTITNTIASLPISPPDFFLVAARTDQAGFTMTRQDYIKALLALRRVLEDGNSLGLNLGI